MAVRQLVISDISATELDDTNHARLVIEHPDFPQPLELDVSTEEADKFQQTTLRMMTVTIYGPDKPVRTVHIETKTADRIFEKTNFDELLQGARKAEAPTPRRGRPVKAAATRGDKVNYADLANAGRPHRGRITDAEKETVRKNLDAVNKRLQSEGLATIDKGDAATKEKWGL